MIYTNTQNVPREIATAAIRRASKYKKLPPGEYSVTEILNPPRQIHLTRRHHDEIEVDVSQLLYSYVGSLLHDDVQTNEERFTVSEPVGDDVQCNLSGEPDIIDGSEIRDLKYTSVWSVIFGDSVKKWEAQLNIYAYLYDCNSWRSHRDVKSINKLTILVQFRDWSKNQSFTTTGYPKSPSYEIPIKRWSKAQQGEYITNKLREIYLSEHVRDRDLPLCPDEDRWIRQEGYALMKEGRKRAVRVLPTEKELEKYCKENKIDIDDGTHYVEERKSQPRKCQEYCNAAPFCSQYQDELKEKAK